MQQTPLFHAILEDGSRDGVFKSFELSGQGLGSTDHDSSINLLATTRRKPEIPPTFVDGSSFPCTAS